MLANNKYLTLSAVQFQNGLLWPTINTVHKAASWFEALTKERDVGYWVTTYPQVIG